MTDATAYMYSWNPATAKLDMPVFISICDQTGVWLSLEGILYLC